MEKLILKDGTELEIRDGASVNAIEMEVADYAALETLAFKLNKEKSVSGAAFRIRNPCMAKKKLCIFPQAS